LRASNLGQPVTLANPLSAPARAYNDAARRLLGDIVALNVPNERFNLLGRIFGGRAA
jgi:septum site-determining protein MinD